MPNGATASKSYIRRGASAPKAEGPVRSGDTNLRQLSLYRLLFLLAVFAVWQIIVKTGLVDEFWISKPSKVLAKLAEILPDPQLYSDIFFTMKSTLIGFGISLVAGVFTAILFYKYPLFQKIVDPFVLAIYSTPRLALAPLFIIWFGIGLASKIALVVSLAYFIILLNAYAGLVNVNPRLLQQVRTMGASDWFIFRRVSLPASVPWLLSGARVALGFSLVGAVVGELIISEKGVGLRIAKASGLFDTTSVFAYLIIIALIGMALDQGVRMAERRFAGWGGQAAN